MSGAFEREELLIGVDCLNILKNSRVAVFGTGGVGSYAVEALARAGVGALDLIDNDVVSLSNVNRQLIATLDVVGRYKTEVCAERIARINPDCKVTQFKLFYLGTPQHMLDFSQYNYVIDAIDTVTGKLAIIENSKKAGVPVISCMGTGNKLDPTAFEVIDISKTSVCPLAKVIRRELKARGISGVKVVYSKEEPLTPASSVSDGGKRQAPGSISFVPSVAGLIIAGEVIKDLCGLNK
ncbi:MAG: tRNA threonylcarbamoyladenosine dehydratase [Clostridia bacterium]|nr:tRNA threonylcarbamoyladenosine dehydratase [Clostridia bacterium]